MLITLGEGDKALKVPCYGEYYERVLRIWNGNFILTFTVLTYTMVKGYSKSLCCQTLLFVVD